MNMPHPFEALVGREVIVYSGDSGTSSDRGRVEFCDAAVVVITGKDRARMLFPLTNVRLIKIVDGKV